MKRLTYALAVLLLATTPAFAGVILEVENAFETPTGSEVQIHQMKIEGPRMKIDVTPGKGSSPDEKRSSMIFRGDLEAMYALNHAEREYMVIDRATVEKLGEMVGSMNEQMEKAKAMMEERLKDLSPEQRAQAEKMMKERMGDAGMGDEAPEREFKNTGKTEEKMGYPSTLWEAWTGGEKVMEIWVTDWSNVEGGQEAAQAMKAVAAFSTRIMESMKRQEGVGQRFFGASGNPLDGYDRVDGFPILTRHFTNGKVTHESRLRSAEKADVSAATFEPPADYTRRTLDPGMR